MNHDIIVLGSSTGGIEIMLKILKDLPKELPASIFIVQHVAPTSQGYLAQILKNVCQLEVTEAIDNEYIKKGYIYVARPDYHLLIKNGRIKLLRGPKENRSRPAIDPLFRSAAAFYGARVIGIILSGSLNDGTAGLLAVKDCGGVAIVQSPDEATCSSMPQSALDNVCVDYCLPAADIAAKLIDIVDQKAEESCQIPENILPETTIAENGHLDSESQDISGDVSVYSCPECGGRLWEMNKKNKFLRFRCHLGHDFTAASMLSECSYTLDTAFEIALRTLEEKTVLLKQMAEDSRILGQDSMANIYEKQAKETLNQSEMLNKLLMQR